MAKKRSKRRHSKWIVLMMLPALIFIAVLGYLAYWNEFTRQRRPAKKNRENKTPVAPRDDGVTFLPAFGEEETQRQTSK